jgi:small subunit ribosomal protein S20
VQRNLSAEKDARQSEKRRLRNRRVKTHARTLAKGLTALVAERKKDEAVRKLAELSAYLDQAVSKGIYHRNTAARKKSRMSHLIASLES